MDNKFSLEMFLNAYEEESKISELTSSLEQKIQNEIHSVLDAKLKDIVEELNSQGHKLTLYYPSKPGDISYRDVSSGKCLLRVSGDLVISIGFSDTENG